MGMEAISSQETLVSFLDPVDALVAECKVHIDDAGLRIAAVDPANVGMTEVRLDADGFETYSADDAVVGIGLDGLTDTLSLVGDALVHLALPATDRRLQFRAGRLEREFATIDPESVRAEPDIPDLDGLPLNAVVTGADLDEIVSAADLVNDQIVLGVDAADETLTAHADGDTDVVDVTLPGRRLIDYRYDAGAEQAADGGVQSQFSLDYLSDMVGVIPDDAEVRIRLGHEYPLRMEYALADRTVDVTAMLSPRIKT